MKEKILIIEDYNSANQEQVKHFLDLLLKTEDLDLEIQWRFYQRKITQKLLSEIASLIRSKGEHREFSVLMVIETNQWRAVKRLRKCLNQYGITVKLALSDSLKPQTVLRLQKQMLLEYVIVTASDYTTLRKISDPYWKAGVSLIVRGCNLDVRQYTSWFDQWIQTCDGGWIDIFMDAVSCLYTGIHTTDCCHDSCLGKYLYLDAQGNSYFCAEKKAESLMQNIPKNEIYSASYTETLKKAIKKRKSCTDNCAGFASCQGGCPLSEDRLIPCTEYLDKLDYIRDYILAHSEHMFFDVPNPGLRQMFLNAAAFGFRMKSRI